MKTRLLKLSEIVTTGGTQIRARIDSETVNEYAEAMQDATTKFPPVVVFHDGNQYVLADGFHRVMAASRNGFLDISADVHKGTKSDALKFALGANSSHGLKRKNADKRRSVELALAEWPKLSDREIARICGVGAPMVGDVRGNCNNVTVEPPTRIGADGKERRIPSKPQPERHQSAEPEQVQSENLGDDHHDRALINEDEVGIIIQKVEQMFRTMLQAFPEENLPIIRNWIRAELKKTEEGDK